MAANYNCLIFDLDSTLFDDSQSEKQAILDTLRHFDLDATENNAERFLALNTALNERYEKGDLLKEEMVVERFSTLLKEIDKEHDPIELNNYYNTCLSRASYGAAGAAELLDELAEFCTLVIVSNGPYRAQKERLEKAMLLRYFDEIYTSDKLKASKPSPKAFHNALNRLGINNRAKVLIVGDNFKTDMQGGVNAKLDTCWYNPTGKANETKIEPTHTAKSYTELKLIAVGEEALERAATREKRHIL